jgi:hypothetical protein
MPHLLPHHCAAETRAALHRPLADGEIAEVLGVLPTTEHAGLFGGGDFNYWTGSSLTAKLAVVLMRITPPGQPR